jgi:preprotein translocase subunit SecY
MIKSLKSVFEVEHIRKKIIATLALVLVYKILSVIPVPWANTEGLKSIFENGANSGLWFFSALMWGWLKNFSIILMWLSPYINAVIIIQLLGVIIPKIGDLQKEWEQGQKIITKWTRRLTLPLAFAQSYGMILLMNNLAQQQIINTWDLSVIFSAMIIISAWTMFLMWLWEIMTEYGIWNGISIIITAWVLSAVPQRIMWYIEKWDYPLFVWILLATLAIIYVIIKFTEWNRRIPVIYTRTGREEKSYFPIRINQAGMIPIIFAVSLVTFPSILGQLLAKSTSPKAQEIGNFMQTYLNMNSPTWTLVFFYFLLVVAFSFFYVSITFNTEQVAESIQKRGGYIPWIRPGADTANYLAKVSTHLNLFGWSFLALIAVLPYVVWLLRWGETTRFIISGAWLIIIVSVILDLIRKVDTEVKMYDYSKFK